MIVKAYSRSFYIVAIMLLYCGFILRFAWRRNCCWYWFSFPSSACCYYNRTHVVVVCVVVVGGGGGPGVLLLLLWLSVLLLRVAQLLFFWGATRTYRHSRISIRSSQSSRSRKRRRHWDGVCWLQFVVPAMVYVRCWMMRYLSIIFIIIIRKKRYIPYYDWCHAQYCNDNSMQ